MEKEIKTTVGKGVKLNDFVDCHLYTLGFEVGTQWI